MCNISLGKEARGLFPATSYSRQRGSRSCSAALRRWSKDLVDQPSRPCKGFRSCWVFSKIDQQICKKDGGALTTIWWGMYQHCWDHGGVAFIFISLGGQYSWGSNTCSLARSFQVSLRCDWRSISCYFSKHLGWVYIIACKWPRVVEWYCAIQE